MGTGFRPWQPDQRAPFHLPNNQTLSCCPAFPRPALLSSSLNLYLLHHCLHSQKPTSTFRVTREVSHASGGLRGTRSLSLAKPPPTASRALHSTQSTAEPTDSPIPGRAEHLPQARGRQTHSSPARGAGVRGRQWTRKHGVGLPLLTCPTAILSPDENEQRRWETSLRRVIKLP